ncbi:hypothetical protein [Reinekea thalattae]|uniref:Uncharacterized protein n=1 Tax=Reinekea thalattae TaxID=2593301 RepID=A0A5C8Z3L4_9GAMM|nr:hypothetical protein [Reinekea thalattae]TXR51904.1 hypothetical protein FME95_10790 [Reinekea thalattae]
MTYLKLNSALLAASVALVGCGAESGGSSSRLTLANPIADIELDRGNELDYSIPSDVCTTPGGYSSASTVITDVSNNLGFQFNHYTTGTSNGVAYSGYRQIYGYPTEAGEVSVTVTCIDQGERLTDEFTITVLENDEAPNASISFPFDFGDYSSSTSMDVFGNFSAPVGESIRSLEVKIKYKAGYSTVSDISGVTDTWRRSGISLDEVESISVTVTAENDYVAYDEVILNNGELYSTSIDDYISDIAVDEATGDIYVHSDGDYVSQIAIKKFNLDSGESEELSYTADTTYGTYVRSSIAIDTDNLYVSASSGITKINLSNGIETVLSDANAGSGVALDSTLDLIYSESDDLLYAVQYSNHTIVSIDPDTGDRAVVVVDTDEQPMSMAINESTGSIYYSRGVNITGDYILYEYDGSSSTQLTYGDSGAVSDLAYDESNNILYYVDGAGDLTSYDISANAQTTVVADLFALENLNGLTTPLIGLHYHSERNLLIAAGKDTDGTTNLLLAIDPESGNYAKLAEGN